MSVAQRVLHVPFGYFPDAAGGTEVYVAALARELTAHGFESIIAAPDRENREYKWNGVSVHRFAVQENPSLETIYGDGDAVAAAEFARILDRTNPDIVHFHALTSGASLLTMREVKRRGKPLLLTYHTPTVSCARGTMMRWGREACDGKLDDRLCVACSLHQKGVPLPVANSVSLGNINLSKISIKLYLPEKIRTMMHVPALIRERSNVTRSVFDMTDGIVAVCEWVRQVLLANGVAERRIRLCRQGLTQSAGVLASNGESDPLPQAFSNERPLKLAYFGRLDVTKGVHTLLQAVKGVPQLPLTLDVYGVSQGEGGIAYRARLTQISACDQRVRFHDPVASDQVVSIMKSYHLITIPSEWLETGPLVVYEAFAARVPVLGSNLGGITELIEDGKNGGLVHSSSVSAWREALVSIAGDPKRIEKWRQQLPLPRTMKEVAREMAAMYGDVSAEQYE